MYIIPFRYISGLTDVPCDSPMRTARGAKMV